MLRTIPQKLQCPVCWDRRAELLLHIFRKSEVVGAVRDGVLICDRCAMWYPIDDHLLRLEPTGLQNTAERAGFLSWFSSEASSLSLSSEVRGQNDQTGLLEAQRKQRLHFDA